MQVTADSLFHFTTSLRKLEGIIRDKFRISYCAERCKLDYETHDSVYPIVSFCDVPLSMAKNLRSYGDYAIGLTKQWGIANQLNPVVYVEANSILASDIQNTIDGALDYFTTIKKQLGPASDGIRIAGNIIKRSLESIPDTGRYKVSQPALDEATAILKSVSEGLTGYNKLTDQYRQSIDATLGLFRFIKNYQGELRRKNKVIKNYRFYDEREWRYVHSEDKGRHSEDYKKYKESGGVKPFIKDYRLSFGGEDIKYLIVKSSKDIPRLIETIHSTNKLVENSKQGDILTTKIMTIEQINADF